MNSYSPKRRPTAKMRAMRTSLAKVPDPLFQPLERVAQPRHGGREAFMLRARDEDAALLGGIIRERRGEPRGRVCLPGEEISRTLREAMRDDVAEHARQILLGDIGERFPPVP